ncbi:tRNA 2-selenouridine(34) synthase MnmH [Pusillimonas sp. T2]|uniref:tRNA 2-selenouridine(34) synthase MnmH n=1 Tax=Pusillimonas sp. T2 TaxID=1548123 RepID=UPI000B9CD0F9|nr:tRNA 2-selenouridine(34) synthase MnmH [Pusillimonas sp. T2]OXR50091.1 tRNA 2-selenouridine(34) synthase MnmH [Pusillimonas sp. T2]
MTRNNTDDFRTLFLSGVPLMDVRAPVEFGRGAFPGAVNLPLMNDIERQKVGTCYKLKGQDAAITLGHQLVSGKVKAQRIEQWAAFAMANPNGYLYCFRGGLRSRISQEWLATEAGINYPRVVGGYKAMRTYLMGVLEQAIAQCRFVVVGGMTGSGKTDVLCQLDNAVDLEGLANHRGSSFGKRVAPQPAQISFENALSIDLLKRQAHGQHTFVLEDESRLIGSCALPLPLHQAMQGFPVVWLEDTFESRVERILRDYVESLAEEFVAVHGPEQGFDAFAQRMRQSLGNIVKRLGHERYRRLAGQMDEALAAQHDRGTIDLHRVWIAGLLHDYYDPMYASQRERKGERIVFSGRQADVVEYLRRHYA